MNKVQGEKGRKERERRRRANGSGSVPIGHNRFPRLRPFARTHTYAQTLACSVLTRARGEGRDNSGPRAGAKERKGSVLLPRAFIARPIYFATRGRICSRVRPLARPILRSEISRRSSLAFLPLSIPRISRPSSRRLFSASSPRSFSPPPPQTAGGTPPVYVSFLQT